MDTYNNQKRIALSGRGRIAAGAITASLAVAVAVPAFGVASRSGIEFDIDGLTVVDGMNYVAKQDNYIARITVPSGLVFDAENSSVFAKGVDSNEVDVWSDVTPATAKDEDPKVYETTLSSDEVLAGAKASIVVSKRGFKRPAETLEIDAAHIDSETPVVTIKMSQARVGQASVKVQETDTKEQTVDFYSKKGLKATVSVDDATFDASATKVNGVSLGDTQWTKSGTTHTATIDCAAIQDIKVEAADKMGNSSVAEYGQQDSTVDADGNKVDGQVFRVDASLPQTSIEFNGTDSKSYFKDSEVTARVTVSAFDYSADTKIEVNGEAQDDWVTSVLDDGSRVFEKTFGAEGSYQISVNNNKVWGKVPGDTPKALLVIDRTAPVVDVSWDKTEATNEKYFSTSRTATVTITDDNFNAGATTIKAKGATVGAWSVDSKDPSKHVATVKFEKDGTYDLTVEALDLAGNAASTYDSGEFVIDQSAPRIDVSWDNEGLINHKYCAKARTATVFIAEDNYDQALVKVDGATVVWDKRNPRKGTAVFFDDGVYDLKISASDLAGNVAVAYDSSEFIVDKTAPTISVSWDNQDAKGSYGEKTYYDAARTATISFSDDNFDQSLVSVEGGTLVWDEKDPKTATVSFAADGEYRLRVHAADLAGNVAESYDSGIFVVDLVSPQATVTYDLNEPKNDKYFSSARTATIVIDELNFDKDLIEVAADGDDGSFKVLDWVDEGSKHTATVVFGNSDKALGLKVAGTDLAGRAVEFGKLEDGSAVTSYDSGEFFVDDVAPLVSVARDKAATNSYQGVDYFNEMVTATVTVVDDHFDASASSLSVSGCLSESGWVQSESDPHTWTKTVVYDEGAGKTLGANVVDLAGNKPDETKSNLGCAPFTVDTTAPEVSDASVNVEAANNYSTNFYFYNRAVAATISLRDNISLESIGIVDGGDGYYGQDVLVSSDAIVGNASATATLTFADGHEFDRDVVVKATDLSKNVRYWSIAPTGKVRVLSDQEVENLSIYNPSKIYPQGLLKDTVAPKLALSGIEEGAYYNTEKTVMLTVDELNYPYLQSYEPEQGVFTVTKQEGSAGRAQSSWTRAISYLGVTAREGLSFTDDRGTSFTYDQYGMSETFAQDGHYVIDAQVADPAKNQGTAHLAEFTIDRTAPTVEVSFDNNDARNGKYYKASRTATITVTEHNFDSSLIQIDTTGSVGAWSDNGDTHTVTVSFASDGVHSLAVSGKDKAGNELSPYKADEFVVDLVAPTVSITGVENSFAYKGEVKPVISFADEANFDASAVRYTLAGTKNGEVSYEVATLDEGLGKTVSFADFAREAAVDDIYTLTAHISDLAGNEAEASLTFSVNRFGSTFRVVDADSYKDNDGYLTKSRAVVVEEINVSGVASEEHSVSVTSGMNTTELKRNETASDTGFTITEETSGDADSRGWALYRYNIPATNFQQDGRYHVSVRSNDLASNINSSSDFYDRVAGGESAAEVDFILDTTDPVITNLSVSEGAVIEAEECQVTFKVVENIGVADVKVLVDGNQVDTYYDAYGNYNFKVKQASFTDRSVEIVATDLAGRTGEAQVSGFRVTTDIFELHLAWVIAGATAALAAVAGIVYALVKRSKQESKR